MTGDEVASGEGVASDRPRAGRTRVGRVRVGGTVALTIAALTTGAVLDGRRDVARMEAAAVAFLAELAPDQRARASFEFSADERSRWHFIPNETFERHGLMLADMDGTQRRLALELLQSGLSQRGYLTATQVMELEDVLLALEGGGRFARDREQYFLAVFGTPGSGAWGWRFEGHHISLHFTIGDGSVAVAAPAFVGANPAEVREGPQRGRRVLADREDAARALLESLDAGQRRTATLEGAAPRDILTAAEVAIDPLTPVGLSASAMSASQRALLVALIEVYAGMMTEDVSARRLAQVRDSGIERVTFAWAGEHERGGPHYYRVQGPTFLIEYDNTQNDANHIHSVWRDFDGDFGRDLLREHLEQDAH